MDPRRSSTRRPHTRYCRLLLAVSLAAPSCTRTAPDDDKIHLTYWEKWVRFEGQTMQAIVNEFNASQDRIVVHMTTFGPVDRKTLLATAGGNPPDLAGMWAPQVASQADRDALTPLDEFMERDGISRDHWLPVYRDLSVVRGKMYAIPTTPTAMALHWNKALFRAAGLDPERPPRTLAELDELAHRLTRFDAEGNIIQMGFLPYEPDWYVWGLGPWFGGTLFDGEKITANHPLNVAALDWVQSYSRRYGPEKIKRFLSGFGNFASPQNAFFSGKLAMAFHGVWLDNYISQFAPGLDYGVAPFPRTPHGPENFSIADMDVLVIPAGVPPERREAAWQFLKFVASQSITEKLCLGQRKNTPLAKVSPEFIARHPHPAIELFIELSRSPNVTHLPQMGIWTRYEVEIRTACERMRLLQTNPKTGRPFTAKEVLDDVQARMSTAWERHMQSLRLHHPEEVAHVTN
jgi:multiple sugar transport system substrate-binding protein